MKYKIEQYKSEKNKLVLLDYDGTLVDYAVTPDAAKPSAQVLKLLSGLNSKPQTRLVVVTGRRYQDIDKFIGHLPIDIVAEHGGMHKEKGVWKKQQLDAELWKKQILPVLNRFVQSCPKSFIEEKHFGFAWHYRKLGSKAGHMHSRELIRILEVTSSFYNVKILDGNKVVEIMAGEIGKGKAVRDLAGQNNYEYILSIGDDKTDEEMFEYLLPNVNADTIKVGDGRTFAKYKLDNVSDVISLLKQLTLLY